MEPKTKAARLREILPAITQKIAEGVRVADIVRTLREQGLELSEGTLKNYLSRHRAGKVARAASSQTGSAPPAARGTRPLASPAEAAPDPEWSASPNAQTAAASAQRECTAPSERDSMPRLMSHPGGPLSPVEAPSPKASEGLGQLEVQRRMRPDPAQSQAEFAELEREGEWLLQEERRQRRMTARS
ncbi:hypothetical protein [Variovorax jilinensis]|uniref:hypothetical protein n=1 Tax=Variovorax jilinensis TaxID=3053513 RepID=UPI0025771309|nr:hypothetical protein [Variovorax sp. J22P168]